jgi:glycosidase
MKFWIDKGVAGFRVDAAKEFYTGNVTKNIEVMNWLQTTASSIKEDVYMVAEVWEGFSTLTRYYESGFTSLFNFPFGNAQGKIPVVVNGAGNPSTVSTYATALEKADKEYRSKNPNYIDAPFVSNHDVGRIAGFVAYKQERMKLVGAMNLFMGGSAFIYYGEEIGMKGSGNDPSKRAPMYWNAARNEGTTNPPPECELPEKAPFPSLEEQKDDPYSIYNYYRQAIAIRQALPVIARGQATAETALNVDCVSAHRKTWGDEQCIIIYNIDKVSADVDLSAYADWTLATSLAVDTEDVTLDDNVLHLPAYGTAVLIPKK